MDYHFPRFLRVSRLTNISVTSAKSTGARRSGPAATTVDGDRRGSPSVLVWRTAGAGFSGGLIRTRPIHSCDGAIFFGAFEGPSDMGGTGRLGDIRTWEPWNAGILEAVG